ncbi:MAG: hypothetical protein ABW166_05205 [Sedimenticola sp.]
MKKNKKDIEERLYPIYKKHVNNYQHKDTKQMCCMWSTTDLPDEVYECDQIYDIENEFCITFTEDDALEMYDMGFGEAVNFVYENIKSYNKSIHVKKENS